MYFQIVWVLSKVSSLNFSSSSSFELIVLGIVQKDVHALRGAHALFARFQLDWATTMSTLFAPSPVCHMKMEAFLEVPCPRTQQASSPACSPPYNNRTSTDCEADALTVTPWRRKFQLINFSKFSVKYLIPHNGCPH